MATAREVQKVGDQDLGRLLPQQMPRRAARQQSVRLACIWSQAECVSAADAFLCELSRTTLNPHLARIDGSPVPQPLYNASSATAQAAGHQGAVPDAAVAGGGVDLGPAAGGAGVATLRPDEQPAGSAPDAAAAAAARGSLTTCAEAAVSTEFGSLKGHFCIRAARLCVQRVWLDAVLSTCVAGSQGTCGRPAVCDRRAAHSGRHRCGAEPDYHERPHAALHFYTSSDEEAQESLRRTDVHRCKELPHVSQQSDRDYEHTMLVVPLIQARDRCPIAPCS